MWLCYAVALIPVAVGASLWLASRRITFGEWVRGSIIGFAVAGGFHYYTIKRLALDMEIRSGMVVSATHRPERYRLEQKAVARTTEPECWFVTVALGDDTERFGIDKDQFEQFRKRFGATQLKPVPSGRDLRGDPNNYVAENRAGIPIPAYTLRTFDNQTKAGPSISSFSKPPKDAPLFDYPIEMSKAQLLGFFTARLAVAHNPNECVPRELEYFDWRTSKRLLGRAAKDYSIEQWDLLNAELGPKKLVNLIMIGFEGESTLAHWQEAKWLGGKKNDLVLCYGPLAESGTPAWTYCFGWTEDELVKRNLETLLLNNRPGDALLKMIKDEVSASYRRKEWPAFSHFAVPPPASALPTLFIIMIVVQGGYWLRAYLNRDRRGAASEAERQDEADEEARDWAEIRENSAKERIAEELGHLGDSNDVDELTQELLSGDGAYAACLALQRCGDPRAITSLVLGMSSEDACVRREAGEWLNDNAPRPSMCPEAKAATPTLIERLTHDAACVRSAALRVLRKVDPEWLQTPEAREGVDAMLQAVRAGEATESMIDGLGARGDMVVGQLLAILADGEPGSQEAAIRALGRTGSGRAVEPLLDRLGSEDETLRCAAAEGLAMFGAGLRDVTSGQPVYERIMGAYESADGEMQELLAGALGWLGDQRAIETLAERLEDDAVRVAAAEALGRLGSPRALPPLLALAAKLEAYDCADIVEFIGAIGGDAIVDPLIDLFRQNSDAGDRFAEAVIGALGRSGGPKAMQLIDEIAHDYVHAGNEFAIVWLKRLKSDHPQPEWTWALRSGKGLT